MPPGTIRAHSSHGCYPYAHRHPQGSADSPRAGHVLPARSFLPKRIARPTAYDRSRLTSASTAARYPSAPRPMITAVATFDTSDSL